MPRKKQQDITEKHNSNTFNTIHQCDVMPAITYQDKILLDTNGHLASTTLLTFFRVFFFFFFFFLLGLRKSSFWRGKILRRLRRISFLPRFVTKGSATILTFFKSFLFYTFWENPLIIIISNILLVYNEKQVTGDVFSWFEVCDQWVTKNTPIEYEEKLGHWAIHM